MNSAAWPTLIVPFFNLRDSVDACLAALDRTLPAGAPVLLADDASTDPAIEPLVVGWIGRSKLAARHLRQPRTLGMAANCNAAIAQCTGDVVLLKTQALLTPGWMQQLIKGAAHQPEAATLSVWSSSAGPCSFPLLGEDNPVAEFPEAVAEAAASLEWDASPELPAWGGPCLYLRGTALRQLGELDARTFSGERALDDFSRRAAAMGWRNLLCPTVYLPGTHDDAAMSLQGDELARLLVRWPDYQEQVARFLMADPLRAFRQRLQSRIGELARSGPQRDLFAMA